MGTTIKRERIEPVPIAVEALERAKQEITERYRLQIEELDSVIDNVKRLGRNKTWEGMGIPDAVHAFLSNFDGPVAFAKLISGLQEKGVRLGDPTKPQRFQANVKTTITNNRKRFKYDPQKDTVTLIATHVSP